MLKKSSKLFLLLLVLALAVSGCTFPSFKKATPTTTAPAAAVATTAAATANTNQLKKFNSYDELAKFLAANNNPSAAAAPTNDNSATANNYLDQPAADNQGTTDGATGDIIKTDGHYIYALVKNELSIIKAAPASEATVVSKITFKSRPQGLLINGNFLAVFGNDDQISAQSLYQTFRRQNPYTFLKVFDISNPASPQQRRDLDFEGSYSDARLIGDYVYFLTSMTGNYIAAEPVLPRLLDNGQVLPSECDTAAKCFAPDVFYFDIPYDSYNFTSLTAVNIKDNSEAASGQVYLLDNNQDVYISSNNIYITYAQRWNEYDLEQQVKRELLYAKLSADDQNKISKIEAAADFVLNDNEKAAKVAQIIDLYFNSLNATEQTALGTEIDAGLKNELAAKAKESEKTFIYKFAVSGNNITYRAQGEVTGQVLNKLSLDETGNYFRLATAPNQQANNSNDQTGNTYSNIYVLDENLQVVGRLENLATTEKIYAARFIGNRVYLVTFKQADPLYVIGLADPAKPTVLGALKIPGFSNYLYPVDADGNKLISLGREVETTADGGIKNKGLKLSLFDFTDLAKPQELDSYSIGDADSDSIALTDHRAFMYSAEKNLLTIPAVLRANGKLTFSGDLVFAIGGDSLTLKGQIDHSAAGHFTQADSWQGFNYYDNTAKRSLDIDDNLYTLSNKFLKINDLKTLKETKSLELTTDGDDYTITSTSTGTGIGTSAGDPASADTASADATPTDTAAAPEAPAATTTPVLP